MHETQQEPQIRFPGREDPLEKEMATHSSILAWKIPWTAHGLAEESDTTWRLNNSKPLNEVRTLVLPQGP